MAEIIEILGRSEQGVTEPFICQASDGKRYYVKGKSAGYRDLRNEYIAGKIAQMLALPIAPFKILESSEELIGYSSMPDIKDLGSGLVFGSEIVSENVTELSSVHMEKIPLKQQCDILFFDLLVQNSDRTLYEDFKGNPNLLWENQSRELIVIDHNNAFDLNFDIGLFTKRHVFAKHIREITVNDNYIVDSYKSLYNKVIMELNNIIEDVPPSWFHSFDEERIYGSEVKSIIGRFA